MIGTIRLVTALLLTVAVAAGMSACSSATAETESPAATTAVAAPSSTPTPVVETRVYTMADSTQVEVDPTRPMPAAVIADITAISQATEDALPAAAPKSPNDPNPSREASSTIPRAEAAASKATGREVVIVYRTFATPLSELGGKPRWLWSATRGAEQEAIEDKAARVAEVEAFIAAQDNPAGWDLIVLE